MPKSFNLQKIVICFVILYIIIHCFYTWKPKAILQYEKEKVIQILNPSPKTRQMSEKSKITNLKDKEILKLKSKTGSKLPHGVLLEACANFENNSFSSSMEKNINIVKNYTFAVPNEYLQRLQLDKHGLDILLNRKQNSSIPVIISAVSNNHFPEIIGLLNTINIHVRKMYPDIKLIIYDLGLSKAYKSDLQRMCKCDVQQFPFDKYPTHVKRLQGYTWKPIVLQMGLQKYDFIMYVDSSIRFNEKVSELFDRARRTGIQILEGSGSIAVRTHRKVLVFDFLNEEPCMFNYPEVQAGWILLKRTEFTLKVLLRTVLSCALQYGCMDFPNSHQYISCRDPKKLSACHRFDQSVHGILLTRLFNKDRESITFKEKEFGTLCRGCEEDFLKNK